MPFTINSNERELEHDARPEVPSEEVFRHSIKQIIEAREKFDDFQAFENYLTNPSTKKHAKQIIKEERKVNEWYAKIRGSIGGTALGRLERLQKALKAVETGINERFPKAVIPPMKGDRSRATAEVPFWKHFSNVLYKIQTGTAEPEEFQAFENFMIDPSTKKEGEQMIKSVKSALKANTRRFPSTSKTNKEAMQKIDEAVKTVEKRWPKNLKRLK